MALSNSLNPTFPGGVNALGFDNLSGSGVCVTCVDSNGTTARYVFPSTGNGFRGEITGVILGAVTGTTATFNLTNSGQSVCTITVPTTSGNMAIPSAALANTTIERDNTMGIYLSSTHAAQAVVKAWITYTVEE